MSRRSGFTEKQQEKFATQQHRMSNARGSRVGLGFSNNKSKGKSQESQFKGTRKTFGANARQTNESVVVVNNEPEQQQQQQTISSDEKMMRAISFVMLAEECGGADHAELQELLKDASLVSTEYYIYNNLHLQFSILCFIIFIIYYTYMLIGSCCVISTVLLKESSLTFNTCEHCSAIPCRPKKKPASMCRS